MDKEIQQKESLSLNEYLEEVATGSLKICCAKCGQHFDVTEIAPLTTFICPLCSNVITRPLWLDNYRIDAPVTESNDVVSMTEAVDLNRNDSVTLHILNPSYAASEERCRRFVDVARTIASLHSHTVTPILNVGVIGALPYYITPDLSGKTLQDYYLTQNVQTVPLEKACSWIVDLASAFSDALDREICHGELNLQNIVINENEQLSLMHFGFYELLLDSGYINVNIFTAPETAKNGTFNDRSDIYSLGAFFYYLLTGTDLPADDENGRYLIHFDWIKKMVNDSISELICRMVDPNPAFRPDCAEIVATINARLKHFQYVRDKLHRITKLKTAGRL